jgi:hypothetical protein
VAPESLHAELAFGTIVGASAQASFSLSQSVDTRFGRSRRTASEMPSWPLIQRSLCDLAFT